MRSQGWRDVGRTRKEQGTPLHRSTTLSCAIGIAVAGCAAAHAEANPDFSLHDGPTFNKAIADGRLKPVISAPAADPQHLPDSLAFSPSTISVLNDELVATALGPFGEGTYYGFDYSYPDEAARGPASLLGGRNLRGKSIRFVITGDSFLTPVVWVKSKTGTGDEKVRSFRLMRGSAGPNGTNAEIVPSASDAAGAGELVDKVYTDPGFNIESVTGYCIYYSSAKQDTKMMELSVTVFSPSPGAATLVCLGGVLVARRQRPSAIV